MTNCTRLPAPLLDLVFSRTCTPGHSLAGLATPWHSARRYSHAVALKTRSLAPHIEAHTQSFYARSRKLAEEPVAKLEENIHSKQLSQLEEKVAALKQSTVAEESLLDAATYSEGDLLAIYEDLLEIPSVETPSAEDVQAVASEEEDLLTIQSTAARLLEQDTGSYAEGPSSLVDQLLRRRGHSGVEAYTTEGLMNTAAPIYTGHAAPSVTISAVQAITRRLDSIYAGLEGLQSYLSQRPSIPLGLMMDNEWSVLIRACVREGEADMAERVLSLMRRAKSPISDDSLNEVMTLYASMGDIKHMEAFMTGYVTESPTERQRDLHVKTYVKATPPKTIPTEALSLLHSYENRALPAPQKTYHRLITHLFSARSSIAHAHAWDLFSHMRYAAHPFPDALLYTVMIRACASASFFNGVEPERAMDLFTEMTIEQGITPTAGAYNAVILACARSGRKAYVHEAFRLAKQMLDAYRDARGASEFRPNNRLFCALLEGAKRVGDLARVRWILAEMIRTSEEAEGDVGEGSEPSVRVDEEVMLHVFHTYAAYTPPFKRSRTVIVERDQEPISSPLTTPIENVATTQDQTQIEPIPDQNATFSHLPPQSRAELVAEAETLFSQILETLEPENHEQGFRRNFRHVHVTPRLLNAYLSIHYAHSPLHVSRDLYHTLFSRLSVPKIPRAYIEALERCASTRKGPERIDAVKFAEEIWGEWEVLEAKWRNGEIDSLTERITARQIESATAAMIRLYSIVGQLDRALDSVRAFVQKYPPTAVRQALPKHEIRSTRTVLEGTRPLVRLSSTLDIPDDTVPPLLMFPEVEVLHHRLVAKNRVDGIKYLKWVCKSYEGSLRIRRDRTIKAVPEGFENDERGEDEERSQEEA